MDSPPRAMPEKKFTEFTLYRTYGTYLVEVWLQVSERVPVRFRSRIFDGDRHLTTFDMASKEYFDLLDRIVAAIESYDRSRAPVRPPPVLPPEPWTPSLPARTSAEHLLDIVVDVTRYLAAVSGLHAGTTISTASTLYTIDAVEKSLKAFEGAVNVKRTQT